MSLTCFVHNIVGAYQFCLGRSVVLLIDETSETVAARCPFRSRLDGCSNLPWMCFMTGEVCGGYISVRKAESVDGLVEMLLC